MLQSLEMSSLENRRSSNMLIFMYKVVEGLVPALPPRERSGSVVECLTRDRGVAGLSRTGVTALCP